MKITLTFVFIAALLSTPAFVGATQENEIIVGDYSDGTGSEVEDLRDIMGQLDIRDQLDNTDGPPLTEEMPIYTGYWGNWRQWRYSPLSDAYACGAEMRFEGKQGLGDDTAANGLSLKFCDITQWNDNAWLTIDSGYWGSWRGRVSCPYNKYINGAQVRYERKQGGGDDTALNGLKIHCVNRDGTGGEWKTVYHGVWGDWKSQVVNSKGMLVSGARMQIEGKQGGGDDTAWNGLEFYMKEV